jgi:hypothetical protein
MMRNGKTYDCTEEEMRKIIAKNLREDAIHENGGAP